MYECHHVATALLYGWVLVRNMEWSAHTNEMVEKHDIVLYHLENPTHFPFCLRAVETSENTFVSFLKYNPSFMILFIMT